MYAWGFVFFYVSEALRSRQVPCVESIDERSEELTFAHRVTARAKTQRNYRRGSGQDRSKRSERGLGSEGKAVPFNQKKNQKKIKKMLDRFSKPVYCIDCSLHHLKK